MPATPSAPPLPTAAGLWPSLGTEEARASPPQPQGALRPPRRLRGHFGVRSAPLLLPTGLRGCRGLRSPPPLCLAEGPWNRRGGERPGWVLPSDAKRAPLPESRRWDFAWQLCPSPLWLQSWDAAETPLPSPPPLLLSFRPGTSVKCAARFGRPSPLTCFPSGPFLPQGPRAPERRSCAPPRSCRRKAGAAAQDGTACRDRLLSGGRPRSAWPRLGRLSAISLPFPDFESIQPSCNPRRLWSREASLQAEAQTGPG